MTLLDILLAAPLIGFVLLLLLPKSADSTIRKAALIISLVILAGSLFLAGPVVHNPSQYSFQTDTQWIAYPQIRYHVGVDGISVWLVLLSTLLTPIAILVSWRSIQMHVQSFYAFLILLEFGLIGVFVALDLFLFYVFWEVSLVPMYFLIGVWGHERRIYAAIKFFLYTFAGSVLMLASFVYLYNRTGTFDYPTLLNLLSTGRLMLSHTEATVLFLAFFLAFAIKVPLFPLHTWLPDAHVEAPTAGSVMLAAVMLKMGAYGLIRFCLPMFPNAARENANWIVLLAIIGIIYGALVAMVQPNMKKLVAYSSVSHLGFVVLGIFSFNQLALDGAVYQMLAHGITTGALFMLVGMLYERRHSLEIKDYGGVAIPAPWLSAAFLVTTLGSIGLPTLCNFVGEYLVLQGAAAANFKWGVFAATGVILSACYMLWLYQRTFLGRAPAVTAEARDRETAAESHMLTSHERPSFSMPDLSGREWLVITPMIVVMIWMGMHPQTFLPSISASNASTLAQTTGKIEQHVKIESTKLALAQPQELADAR